MADDDRNVKAGAGVPLTIYMPPDLIARLDHYRGRDSLRRSAAVRILLREALDRDAGIRAK